jgi:hypothetical protein
MRLSRKKGLFRGSFGPFKPLSGAARKSDGSGRFISRCNTNSETHPRDWQGAKSGHTNAPGQAQPGAAAMLETGSEKDVAGNAEQRREDNHKGDDSCAGTRLINVFGEMSVMFHTKTPALVIRRAKHTP